KRRKQTPNGKRDHLEEQRSGLPSFRRSAIQDADLITHGFSPRSVVVAHPRPAIHSQVRFMGFECLLSLWKRSDIAAEPIKTFRPPRKLLLFYQARNFRESAL